MGANQYPSKQHLRSAIKQKNEEFSKKLRIVGFIFVGIAVILLVTFVALKLSQSGWFSSKRITFEPSCYQTQDCDDNLLHETATSLTLRAKAMGYETTNFQVINKLIVGRISEDTDENKFFEHMTSVRKLEFVSFGKNPKAEGTMIQTSTDNTMVNHETVYLTVLSDTDVQSAKIESFDGQYVVEFQFTEQGSKNFADYTSTHIGQYLGIVLDNKVISCPIINSAITGGSGVIQGNFTYESASELAGILSAKPIPYQLTLHESE